MVGGATDVTNNAPNTLRCSTVGTSVVADVRTPIQIEVSCNSTMYVMLMCDVCVLELLKLFTNILWLHTFKLCNIYFFTSHHLVIVSEFSCNTKIYSVWCGKYADLQVWDQCNN